MAARLLLRSALPFTKVAARPSPTLFATTGHLRNTTQFPTGALATSLSRSMAVLAMESEEKLLKTILDSPNKLVVVDWAADWCGPCKMIEPIVDKLSNEYSSNAVFVRCDADSLSDTAAEAGVTVLPTFHFLRGGASKYEVIDQFSGADPQKLREKVRSLSGTGAPAEKKRPPKAR